MLDDLQVMVASENRQQVYEQLLIGASYQAAGYVIQRCGWVKAEAFSDWTCGQYWAGLLQHGDASKAALDANLYAKITTWAAGAVFQDCEQYAAKMMSQRWLTFDVAPALGALTKALQDGDAENVRQLARALASDVPVGIEHVADAVEIGDLFLAMLQTGVPVIKTGIFGIDRALGGLERQCQTVLAASPRTGKTALALQIARQVASSGRMVLFFSLEMSAIQLWARMACGDEGIEWRKVKANEATADEKARLTRRTEMLQSAYGANLRIDGRGQTTESIWRLAANLQPALIIIDHVSLIRDQDRQGNETHRLDNITKTTKQMVKELNTTLLLLCQLNRQVDKRPDHLPQLSDLRDSGGIEQNADVVLMPHRPDMYADTDNRIRWITGKEKFEVPMDVYIRKERSGVSDTVIGLGYCLPQQWFYSNGEQRPY